MLRRDQPLKAECNPKLLKGVTVIKGRQPHIAIDARRTSCSVRAIFTAIPYYAWANRGRGQMEVWIPNRSRRSIRRRIPAWLREQSDHVGSARWRKTANNDPKCTDQEKPASSNDAEFLLDWLHKQGNTEWVQYDFAKPAKVSSVEVYWFQETGNGAMQLPSAWRMLYMDGDEWKPVETAGSYETCRTSTTGSRFKPVTTRSLRLEVTAQPDKSRRHIRNGR